MNGFMCVMSAASLAIFAASSESFAASVTLYEQDFENPANYVNNGGDVNIFTSVNQNYGNQPPGFLFSQTNTVETLNVSGSNRGAGTAAFGTGWSDPSGTGGNFALGMLERVQDDRLGLSFNVGSFDFFNVGIDISSIDLSTFSGPFIPVGGEAPIFRFSLFDNPSGVAGIGSGSILDSFDLTGQASARDTFSWTRGNFGLSTVGNTNGNVIFQIDLIQGEYAAFDNISLSAADTPPNPSPIPVPAGLPLLIGGLGLLAALKKRK